MRPNERGSLDGSSKLHAAAWSAIGSRLDPNVRPDEKATGAGGCLIEEDRGSMAAKVVGNSSPSTGHD